MSANFDAAFGIVVGAEGVLSMDPQDPGNWSGGAIGSGALKGTKYGISAKRYPAEDIANLTLDRAKFLYLRDYWNPHQCEFLPWEEALLVFDTAVNGGKPDTWHKMFSGSPDFVANYQAEHALYLVALPGWPHEGRGWSRRLIKLALAASRNP